MNTHLEHRRIMEIHEIADAVEAIAVKARAKKDYDISTDLSNLRGNLIHWAGSAGRAAGKPLEFET